MPPAFDDVARRLTAARAGSSEDLGQVLQAFRDYLLLIAQQEHTQDRRFRESMGFLVAKGFLKTNFPVPLLPNKRLRLEDVLWAGTHVEPRILEVLPAAVLRLEQHRPATRPSHDSQRARRS